MGIKVVRGGRERERWSLEGRRICLASRRAVLVGALKAKLMVMAARKRMMNDCASQNVYTSVHEIHEIKV